MYAVEPQAAASTGSGKVKAKPTAVVTPQAAGKARGQMKKSSSTAKAKVSTALSNQVLSTGHGVLGATTSHVGVIRNPVATVNPLGLKRHGDVGNNSIRMVDPTRHSGTTNWIDNSPWIGSTGSAGGTVRINFLGISVSQENVARYHGLDFMGFSYQEQFSTYTLPSPRLINLGHEPYEGEVLSMDTGQPIATEGSNIYLNCGPGGLARDFYLNGLENLGDTKKMADYSFLAMTVLLPEVNFEIGKLVVSTKPIEVLLNIEQIAAPNPVDDFRRDVNSMIYQGDERNIPLIVDFVSTSSYPQGYPMPIQAISINVCLDDICKSTVLTGPDAEIMQGWFDKHYSFH